MNNMENTKTLGDYCKWFEKNFSPEIMIPELPVIIRLDGNNFSKWTKDLNKPFDERLNNLMTDCVKMLVKETNAVIGYQQSDEITLILYSNDIKSKIYNDGKKQKILSKLTAKLVNFFNSKQSDFNLRYKEAVFDCRIYQVPTLDWAVKQLLWRELDATKNSKYMLAHSLFPHNSLQGLNGSQLQDKMMLEKNVNWNDLPVKFKRGVYVKNCRVSKKLTVDELESLPPKHNARLNPDAIIERNIIKVIDMPIFSKVENKIGVVFYNEDPKLLNETVTI